MTVPKTYKSLASLLVKIAEHGNDYNRDSRISTDDEMDFGQVIAEIQNWLGENRDLLHKLGLDYTG